MKSSHLHFVQKFQILFLVFLLATNTLFTQKIITIAFQHSTTVLPSRKVTHHHQNPINRPELIWRDTCHNERITKQNSWSTTTATTSGTRLWMSTAPKPKRKQPKPVYLKHERDFFRQVTRLESMDSYVLVSTLTASMSFGALLGFSPCTDVTSAARCAKVVIYNGMCVSVQVVSGLSAILGLYATVMFALTILYGKSALGAERDLEFDKFLRRTVRSRVHGARCFTLSLASFALEAFLVLMERTFHKLCFIPVAAVSLYILFHLYRDWRSLFKMAEYIY